MAENSKIEWTTHTFNPWRGCTKVAAGCANCYADAMSKRNPAVLGVWGDNGTRVLASEKYWTEPLAWNAAAEAAGERPRVFCASLADVFEDWQGPISSSGKNSVYLSQAGRASNGKNRMTLDDVRARLFALIDATPALDWLLLTKRPENVRPIIQRNPARRMWKARPEDHGPRNPWYRGNLWLLTSIAEQADADRNVPELLKCRDLVPVLGLSAEPLVGPVEFSDVTRRSDAVEQLGKRALTGIDWVIAGGESGAGARPMHPDWARSLRDQCLAAGVPFFFKQWGEWAPSEFGVMARWNPPPSAISHYFDEPPYRVWRFGKKAAGRELDGRTWDEYPRTAAAVL